MPKYSRLSNRLGTDYASASTVFNMEHPSSQQITYKPSALVINQSSRPASDLAVFTQSITRVQADVYVAALENATILPNGFVVDKDGNLVLESIFPWSPENVCTSHKKWIDLIESGQYKENQVHIKSCVHLRSPAEPGYFHWIQTTLPRLHLGLQTISHEVPVAISSSTSFSRDFLNAIHPNITLVPTDKIVKVDLLFFPAPMQYEGDHFHRPEYANTALGTIGSMIKNVDPSEIIYISRSDAGIRNFYQEELVSNVVHDLGGQTYVLTGMPIQEQVALFQSSKIVISPHGAGLANTAFMRAGTKLVEFISPQRLWPTFKCIANRVGIQYFGIVGNSFDVEQTAMVGVGNEKFSVDPNGLGYILAAIADVK